MNEIPLIDVIISKGDVILRKYDAREIKLSGLANDYKIEFKSDPPAHNVAIWQDLIQYSLALAFYISEVVTWLKRESLKHDQSTIQSNCNYNTSCYLSNNEFIDDQHMIDDYETKQMSINIVILILIWIYSGLMWGTFYRSTSKIQIFLTLLSWVGLIICDTIGVVIKNDVKQLVINIFGYMFNIWFWAIDFHREPDNDKYIKYGRYILVVLHLIFFASILSANLITESGSTIEKLGSDYVGSIFENILLFELLHIIIENIYH
jgi:hypothetical protein